MKKRKLLIGILVACLIFLAILFIKPEKPEEKIAEVPPILKIKGPGDAIFNFADDGYWWPGRTVEKWITIENIGTLSLIFDISSRGENTPIFDAKGDGANVPLKISWPDWEDLDGDDRDGKWHIKPGGS